MGFDKIPFHPNPICQVQNYESTRHSNQTAVCVDVYLHKVHFCVYCIITSDLF